MRCRKERRGYPDYARCHAGLLHTHLKEAMPQYLFFVLDDEGRTVRSEEAECDTDDAARRFADALLDQGGQVEVWSGHRRLGWIFPRPYPSRGT